MTGFYNILKHLYHLRRMSPISRLKNNLDSNKGMESRKAALLKGRYPKSLKGLYGGDLVKLAKFSGLGHKYRGQNGPCHPCLPKP